MSGKMFGNFRERLQTVQHDFSAGLKNLTDKAKEVGKPGLTRDRSKKRDLAGAELLYRYKESWMHIHKSIEETAAVGESVDTEVWNMVERYEGQARALSHLHTQLETFPGLVQELSSITEMVAGLSSDFEQVEQLLNELEDVCEQQELQANQSQHRHKLTSYHQAKVLERENLQVQLDLVYVRKVREMEFSQQERLKERHKMFQDAFNDDLQHYKLYGTRSTLPHARQVCYYMYFGASAEVTTSTNELSALTLDDIMDQSELDNFLGPMDDPGEMGVEAEEEEEEEEEEESDSVTTDTDSQAESIDVTRQDVTQMPEVTGSEVTGSEVAETEQHDSQDTQEQSS
ncbi:DTNBP1 [Branchiostoma lanceolatum]|uniref:DTNBP1 protein n=1 Tax=Branchiostoma lanceolatum TaxID=7740 RepID=A0A8J9Z872_BRALA|nr:DTNBP1 [Branchiostoma lanceolatum]